MPDSEPSPPADDEQTPEFIEKMLNAEELAGDNENKIPLIFIDVYLFFEFTSRFYSINPTPNKKTCFFQSTSII